MTPAALIPAGPDATLIAVCMRFAEADLASWYRYVLAPADLADKQDEDPDWPTLHRIIATPATTPDGWRAKALAFSAWHREAIFDPSDGREAHTTLLASLLRDMVAPLREAIIARLTALYGPLPPNYSARGEWMGWESPL